MALARHFFQPFQCRVPSLTRVTTAALLEVMKGLLAEAAVLSASPLCQQLMEGLREITDLEGWHDRAMGAMWACGPSRLYVLCMQSACLSVPLAPAHASLQRQPRKGERIREWPHMEQGARLRVTAPPGGPGEPWESSGHGRQAPIAMDPGQILIAPLWGRPECSSL